MKKQTDLTPIYANKKKCTMPARHLSNNKNKHYIYTEEDLGEGILDEGVSWPYTAGEKDNTRQKANAIGHAVDVPGNKTCSCLLYTSDAADE